MTKPICGKVARVLNSREIAINIGTANGVTKGMLFDVLFLQSGQIRDPDTNEVLGSIKRTKVRVRVTEVQKKLAVASTYRFEQVNVGGALGFGPISQSLMPSKWITKYETLKKSERETVKEDIDEEDSFVKVGDPVVQVIEEIDVETEKKANA